MTYVSNSGLVGNLVEQGIDLPQLLGYLQVAKELLKRYGSRMKLMSVRQQIAQTDTDFGQFINWLYQLDKLDKGDLEELLSGLRSHLSEEEQLAFELKGKDTAGVVTYLQKQFPGAPMEVDAVDEVRLEVKGGGRYYKRSLDTDLTKLLN